MERIPTTRPMIIAIQKYFRGSDAAAGMSNSFGEIFNAGKFLQSIVTTSVAARVAVDADININGENLR